MKMIAHRGYKTLFIKENTYEAFDNALNSNFFGLEFDVRKTKNDELVLLHDAYIDRTSDCTGLVSNYTYCELLKCNFGSNIINSKIPLLKDVLKRYENILKLVELKTRIDISPILDLINDNTYFMSFDSSYIKELKKKYPQIKCGVLNFVFNSDIDYNLDMVCILDLIATDSLVKYFLKKGIKVFIYGIVGKINYKRDYENLYYILDDKSSLS